jgi:hypothetical protein
VKSFSTADHGVVEGGLGKDQIRYFLYLNGRWRWRPTKAMRAMGFGLVTMGKGGPGTDAGGNPIASSADQQRAIDLNRAWDHTRSGQVQAPARTTLKAYPVGSVGDGYQRAMALRKAARLARGIVWTREQENRDDWPRAWRWLEPEFGDCDPRTIVPEHFLRIDPVSGEVRGLVPKIEQAASVGERHRTIKVWRSLWARMQAMGEFCGDRSDPAKSFANGAPQPRQEIWQRKEVLRLVQVAWRNHFRGLAACMAVAYDSMFSPIDARTLTPAQSRGDIGGLWFALGRAKTGKAAAGTLTKWSQAILLAYLAGAGVDFHATAPIFRTRGRAALPKSRGGKPWAPRLYTKDSLVNDFAIVRALAFGPGETRQLADMRRTGAVEGDAGGGSVADQSNKMANTVGVNNRLRKTYNPVNLGSVRRFDEARAIGAKVLEERKPHESVTSPVLVTLLKSAIGKNKV